jgi:type 1 glutamine amidotransferase
MRFGAVFMTLSVLSALPSLCAQETPRMKALILDGQNNHDWKSTTPVLRGILEETGLFEVEVSTSPEQGQDMTSYKPDFTKYAVVITNYNGDSWCEETRKAFEDYMAGGGGLVVVHAADNSFPDWPAYNEMIGLGGWNGRDEKSGPYLRWRENGLVRDMTPGAGGSHGPQHEILVVTRDTSHPIMAGLPAEWMHAKDEIYNRLRGPAKDLTVLATAITPLDKAGTGEHEPMLFTVAYGKGRVFHTVLGHDAHNMECVGFIVTLQRGTEWAGSGKVTQKVPEDFPTAAAARVRKLVD